MSQAQRYELVLCTNVTCLDLELQYVAAAVARFVFQQLCAVKAAHRCLINRIQQPHVSIQTQENT